MTAKTELEKFKKLLVDERERIMTEQEAIGASASAESNELSDYDNHPADTASDTYERTKNYAIYENAADLIQQIDEALRKIEDETYGLCDRCGSQINHDRLKAIPYATLCLDCQELLERR